MPRRADRVGRPGAAAGAAVAAVGLALGLAGLPVAARDLVYRCDDKSEFKATFTPRLAQVEREGQHWTLARVRAAGEARYLSRKAGVELVTSGKEATLTIAGQPRICRFTVQP